MADAPDANLGSPEGDDSGSGADSVNEPRASEGSGLPDTFDRRLAKAQGERRKRALAARPSPLGLAFRVATELVAGVVVGALIGWFLDRWLGTSPFLLIVFFGLGAAAGIANVIRVAREINALPVAAPEDGAARADAPRSDRALDGDENDDERL